MKTKYEITTLPHSWQTECLNAWILNSSSGIVKAATGTGKSLLALMAIEYLNRLHKNFRTAFITPTTGLQRQWRDMIVKEFCISPDLISMHGGSGVEVDNIENPFHIYVCNTAREKFPLHASSWDSEIFLVADECHRYGSPENSRILNARFDYSLGLSGTPERNGDYAFQELISPRLGGLIFEYGYHQAAEDKIISPFKLTNVAVELSYNEKKGLSGNDQSTWDVS
ncbi:MAG: DEAD/DEAH box helicase family protein [Victivallales bacterium]|nr:DEAD/DEAH box helicase family protein [Victivallales bacterium]